MQFLLLHGWGIKNSIWTEAKLSVGNVSAPCLYEIARDTQSSQFEVIANNLKDSIDKDTIIIAWSIGGLVAMSLLKQTNNVKAAVFIASSPCFVNKQDWLNVIDKKNINHLQANLIKDTDKTLEYFSGLIAHGDERAKQTNKIIREHLAKDEDKKILSSWLDQMLTTDIRNIFSEIDCPILTLLGENDSLIKKEIEKDLKQLNKNIEIRIIKDCGHAPFISKQQQTSNLINEFVDAKFS